MPFLLSGGIICGPLRGSFAVRDYLRSSLGIISALGIICGAVQASRLPHLSRCILQRVCLGISPVYHA